ERGPAGEAIGEGIERNAAARDECLVVAQYGLALGVPRKRVQPVAGQPHHGSLLAQPPVVRIRIDDRVGGVDIRRICRHTSGRPDANHCPPPGNVKAGTALHTSSTLRPAHITVRSGRMTAAVAWPRCSHAARSLVASAMWTTIPRSSALAV